MSSQLLLEHQLMPRTVMTCPGNRWGQGEVTFDAGSEAACAARRLLALIGWPWRAPTPRWDLRGLVGIDRHNE